MNNVEMIKKEFVVSLMNIEKETFLKDLKFELIESFEDFAMADYIDPFLHKLAESPGFDSINLEDVSIDCQEVNSLLDVENFLYETSMNSKLQNRTSNSREIGLLAFSDEGDARFAKKYIDIYDSVEGPVRVEMTIGSPQIQLSPRFVIAAKYWEMTSSKNEDYKELTIYCYLQK